MRVEKEVKDETKMVVKPSHNGKQSVYHKQEKFKQCSKVVLVSVYEITKSHQMKISFEHCMLSFLMYRICNCVYANEISASHGGE